MLRLNRILRHSDASLAISSCRLCYCRCGGLFVPNELPRPQRRNMHSPAVWRDRKKRKSRASDNLFSTEVAYEWLIRHCESLKKNGLMQTSAVNAVAFAKAFQRTTTSGRAAVSRETFNRMKEDFGIESNDDCMELSRVLLRLPRPDFRDLGKRILFSLSEAGHTNATIRIVHNVLLTPNSGPSALRSRELVGPRTHLRRLADEGHDFMAMVLEGKVAFALSNEKQAIDWWERSMSDAMRFAETQARLSNDEQEAAIRHQAATGSLQDLTSPWIELANLYRHRGNHANALRVIKIGVDLDDPISHFHQAQYENNTGGPVGASSKWLFHTTKAAASGHVKAIHELGIFYATTGWKYIEDEPPDHVKPTPFDSYPSDEKINHSLQRMMQGMRRYLIDSLTSQAPTVSESSMGLDRSQQEDIFQHAAFPANPESRMRMALQWLEIGMKWFYVPSFLSAARLRLAEKLWSAAETPKDALNMDASRYDYASKAEFEAMNASSNGRQTAAPTHEPSKPDPDNPFYSPDIARDLLREIFFAAEAQREKLTGLRRAMSTKARLDQLKVEHGDESTMNNSLERHRKWFRYPAVRSLCSDDQRGVLFDNTEGLHNLEREAARICEEKKWDIYDDEGALVFRHGISKA